MCLCQFFVSHVTRLLKTGQRFVIVLAPYRAPVKDGFALGRECNGGTFVTEGTGAWRGGHACRVGTRGWDENWTVAINI